MSEEPMITCREAIEQLWAYIDGELENADEQSVARHLEACKGCYPHYDFQNAFHEFVRRHVARSVPPDLRKRVFLRLLAEDRKEATGGSEAGSPGGED